MEKIRILMLGISGTAGGVESYILNLYKNIDKSRFQFYFLKKKNSHFAYENEIKALGGIIIENCPTRHDIPKYFSFYKKLFKELRFNAVYYNTCDIMSMDFLIFAKRAKVPLTIIHSHNSKNIINQNLYHKISEMWCRKNLGKYADYCFACSENAGLWMFGNSNFRIIKNGIDTKSFQFSQQVREEVRRELGLTSKRIIGFAGRLSRQKRPDFLLEIFKNYHRENPDSQLVIAGDGELRDELKSLIESYSLKSCVRLLGARSDIGRIMCAMDCFVLPSEFEGFPFVLVEAQASGLTCVVSDRVSGECDLTGNITFVSCDSSAKKWAEKISQLDMKTDGRENMSVAIRDKGYDMLTEAKKVERILLRSIEKSI